MFSQINKMSFFVRLYFRERVETSIAVYSLWDYTPLWHSGDSGKKTNIYKYVAPLCDKTRQKQLVWLCILQWCVGFSNRNIVANVYIFHPRVQVLFILTDETIMYHLCTWKSCVSFPGISAKCLLLKVWKRFSPTKK